MFQSESDRWCYPIRPGIKVTGSERENRDKYLGLTQCLMMLSLTHKFSIASFCSNAIVDWEIMLLNHIGQGVRLILLKNLKRV